MPTVGELVEGAVRATKQRYYTKHPPERSQPPGGGFLVPREEPNWGVVTLQALGIWDAEVLECVISDTPECPMDILDHSGHSLPLREMGLLDGHRLRLIVLPAEGDK